MISSIRALLLFEQYIRYLTYEIWENELTLDR
jgi:hypothetical protein